MIRRLRLALHVAVILGCLAPSLAEAQPPPAGATTETSQASNVWLVGGVAFATLRGDCQTCEDDYPYRHAASVIANAGYRVNDRMDVGGELFWMPVDTPDGRIRTTHIDAVAQFRPWSSQGFFVKGGAGMAFVRNWVDGIGPNAINSKVLSVVIGGGWAFRPAGRLGLQVFGAQHVAAIGDLVTLEENIPDVVGNFWSLGVAVVIR